MLHAAEDDNVIFVEISKAVVKTRTVNNNNMKLLQTVLSEWIFANKLNANVCLVNSIHMNIK